ncbi:MAG: hypothetical protein ACFFB5_22950 [Promethearchaeota archaeon]
MTKNVKVIEGWTGPGRQDRQITPLALSEDGLHIDMKKWGVYEWWYFDAHLDNDHTLVIFFYAKNPNPGLQGKSGIEIVLLRPDGNRVQKFVSYSKSNFRAARDKPEITVGNNTLRVEYQEYELPVYLVDVHEGDLGCHLTYRAEVNGWKPGTGLCQFGDLGSFGWIVPFARAKVEGIITDGEQTFQVSGIGYHDHNWLDFSFQKIIRYWMWGRIYSKNFTVSYAFIQCNKKVNNHQVKVLMLAEGQEVILSTGEFSFDQDDFSYDSRVEHQFPKQVTINVPEEMKVILKVNRVLEAQDMLDNFNFLFRFVGKYLLRMHPDYFRILSDFELEVTQQEKTVKETGTTLHEIVIFNPIQEV